MAKVITFGELMLRLQPYDYLRFVQADSFEATFGGGEANVSVSLANYGMDSRFVTKLPSHAIGQMAVNSLRKYGVNTEASASMTVHTLPSRKRRKRILTGIPFLKERTGSTSPESLLRWEKMWCASASRHASLQRTMA